MRRLHLLLLLLLVALCASHGFVEADSMMQEGKVTKAKGKAKGKSKATGTGAGKAKVKGSTGKGAVAKGKTTKGSAGKSATTAVKACTVLGKPMKSVYKLLKKTPDQGLVYAVCKDGKAQCFESTSGADADAKKTTCPKDAAALKNLAKPVKPVRKEKSAKKTTKKNSTAKKGGKTVKTKAAAKKKKTTAAKAKKTKTTKKQTSKKKRELQSTATGAGTSLSSNTTSTTTQSVSRQLGVFRKNSKWPGGVLCYKFESKVGWSDAHLKKIRQAQDAFNNKGIKMAIVEEDEPCEALLGEDLCDEYCKGDAYIRKDGGASSKVGYLPGGYDIFMPADQGVEVFIHEFGHAMGLLHEHVHPDAAVVPIAGNIGVYDMSQYSFDSEMYQVTRPYDRHSIMHYPQQDNGSGKVLCIPEKDPKLYCRLEDDPDAKKCIVATEADCTTDIDFGYQKGDKKLSVGDLAVLKQIYGAGSLGSGSDSDTDDEPAPKRPRAGS